MAKKIKNQKLLSNKNSSFRNYPGDSSKSQKGLKSKSAFGAYSEKLQESKQKKIQKLKDTRNRVLNKKKQNKLVRLSRNPQPGFAAKLNKNIKKNKFALLDEPDQAQVENRNKLTHKGKNLQQLRNFNDMHFDQDNIGQDSQDFDNQHAELHFHGFEEPNKEQMNNGRPKSKNEIYKQIIQKSKAHKRQRQQQYEQNFQAAVQLDEQFSGFVSQLKFRTADSKTRQKIEKKDREYEKLMNELREDEKVIANKVVDNHKKGQEKVKKKKYLQLKQLMEGSDSNEEQDVRGWVKGIDQEQQQISDDNQEMSDIGSDNQSFEEDEQDLDEIDEVQLSSNEDEQEEEGAGQEDESSVKDLNEGRKIIIQDESSEEIELDKKQQLRFGNKKVEKKMKAIKQKRSLRE